MKYLRGNEGEDVMTEKKPAVSQFARQALANIGGSQVYIEKSRKLVDFDEVK